jgi:hypothetical protein
MAWSTSSTDLSQCSVGLQRIFAQTLAANEGVEQGGVEYAITQEQWRSRR